MIKFFGGSEQHMVAVTEQDVQILTIEERDRKIKRLTCNMGNIKRNYSCVALDNNDQYIYAGTTSGKF
jgi:hypothetical protein